MLFLANSNFDFVGNQEEGQVRDWVKYLIFSAAVIIIFAAMAWISTGGGFFS